MPFLTVYATKGGQGTTTTAAALALTANQHGQKVLLIDTDGDLPAILGHPQHHGPGLSDYLTDPNMTLADITVSIREGLDLIPRGTGPITFDTYTYGLVTGGWLVSDCPPRVDIVDCSCTYDPGPMTVVLLSIRRTDVWNSGAASSALSTNTLAGIDTILRNVPTGVIGIVRCVMLTLIAVW